MTVGRVGDTAVSSTAAPLTRSSVNSSAPDSETVYLDHTIVERAGRVSIFRPDGSFLLAGRISMAAARGLVQSIDGDYARRLR